MNYNKLRVNFPPDEEPAATCRNCEYFDGGGLLETGPKDFHGDCLASGSPRFQTTQDQGCKKFFPCSTRWPDADV